jgi:hypothetical protein
VSAVNIGFHQINCFFPMNCSLYQFPPRAHLCKFLDIGRPPLVQLLGPLAGKKMDDFGSSLDQLPAIPPCESMEYAASFLGCLASELPEVIA